MVVGNGLIAKAFDAYKNNDEVIVFASGVSNSSETIDKEYHREIELLLSYKEKSQRLIYFSTCSISDQYLQNSAYTNHKSKVEKIIEEVFSRYLILRLPNLIGHTKNPNTMFNYFKNALLANTQVQIQENAYRYLLDIDDLAMLLPAILKNSTENLKIDVAVDNKQSVLSIYLTIAKVLGVAGNYKLIKGGYNYTLNLEQISTLALKENIHLQPNSGTFLFEKYLLK